MKLTQSQIRMLQSVRSRSQWAIRARMDNRTSAQGRVYHALVKKGLIYDYFTTFGITTAGEQALKDNQKESKPRKALPKSGKRVLAWDEIRTKELKPAFKRAGITRCELNYSGCMVDNYLGFAHSRRRRNIETPEQMREVLICCQNCHSLLDERPHAETESIVKATIAARKVPVVLAVSPAK